MMVPVLAALLLSSLPFLLATVTSFVSGTFNSSDYSNVTQVTLLSELSPKPWVTGAPACRASCRRREF
jgi:hypothetical protein